MALAGLLAPGCDSSSVSTVNQTGSGRSSIGRADHAQQVRIRVLLSRTDRLDITCRQAGFGIYDPRSQTPLFHLPAERKCNLQRSAGRWRLRDANGDALLDAMTVSTATGDTIEIRPGRAGLLGLGPGQSAFYRGDIHCIAQDRNTFAVVNVLPAEQYLAGVVGAEMPASWHKAALRAQSIASRTFALYQRSRSGNRPWDVVATQLSQVYRGLAAESPSVLQAVQATRGIVLTYGPPGREKIFPSYFSSTCGGHTEDGRAVFRDAPLPLTGRKCPYCRSVAKKKYFQWPSVTISKKTVSDLLIKAYPALAGLGRVEHLRILEQSDYGRVRRIEIIGANGRTTTLNGEEFRLAITDSRHPVRSSWYTLTDAGAAWKFENGRGWGHGVGLCQCGSEGMARQGTDCIAILHYYYPDSVLLRAY